MSTHKDSHTNPGQQQNGTDLPRPERHLSDEEVATFIYGADRDRPISSTIPSTARPSALALLHAHADTCDPCRLRVAKALAEDSASALLLIALDAPAPVFDIEQVLVRAKKSGGAGRSHAVQAFPIRSIPTRRPRHYRYAIAASFVFAAAAVTAMAFPGSPLRRLWKDFGQKSGAVHGRRVTSAPRTEASSAVSTSGVAIAPAPDLTVEFRETGAHLPELTVQYCDTTLATLHVRQSRAPQNTQPPDAQLHKVSNASAGRSVAHPERYSVSADRIVVTQDTGAAAGEAMYELIVPSSTRSLNVKAGGESVDVRHLRNGKRPHKDRCDAPMTVAWKH